MNDPGEDKKKHHGDTQSCYIELGPVSGHQHNLKQSQKVIQFFNNFIIFCDSGNWEE